MLKTAKKNLSSEFGKCYLQQSQNIIQKFDAEFLLLFT